jgi:ubiquinone biosynthesis protein
VHLPEALDRAVGERIDVLGLRHVGTDRQRLRAAGAQLALRRRERRRLDVGDDHPHALGREPVRESPPDPAGAAGHDRDLAPEILHSAGLARTRPLGQTDEPLVTNPPVARIPRRRLAVRTLQLAGASARALVVFARESRGNGDTAPRSDRLARALGRALVDACTRLGATFTKVGQIASTRADLLPRALVDELATLRDQVPPFAFDDVRRTVEADLGRPLDALFTAFDPEPVAAASVAQVHRAVWRATGETVAVKVRRPDILEKVKLDRAILRFVGRTAERIVPSLRLVSLAEAFETFCNAVEAQIHLTNEAANNRRFTENFVGDPDVHFPRLVAEACSDAVLTMEFVDGVHERDLEAHGFDIKRIVDAGMRSVCRMIFSHGFVHADLHQGNLRFLPPGRVVFLDLGLIGTLDDADRLASAALLYSFAVGDGETVARLFFETAPHHAVADYAVYEREMADYVRQVHTRGLGNVQITLEIGRLFDILRRHRIQARSHMTMVNLALMTAEGLGKRLDPTLQLNEAALPYLAEALGMRPDAPA